MTDYRLIRKARINVPDLYVEHRSGDYYYRNGFNLRAIAALVPAAAIAIVFALVPYFHAIAGFSWFFGAGLATLFYYFLADRSMPIRDVDGEMIAVPSVH